MRHRSHVVQWHLIRNSFLLPAIGALLFGSLAISARAQSLFVSSGPYITNRWSDPSIWSIGVGLYPGETVADDIAHFPSGGYYDVDIAVPHSVNLNITSAINMDVGLNNPGASLTVGPGSVTSFSTANITVNTGSSLILNNSNPLAFVVSVSGSLLGSGSVTGALYINPGGELTLGSLDFSTPYLEFYEDATLAVELSTASATNRVHVNGSVILNGNLELTHAVSPPVEGEKLFLIHNDGVDPVTGLFSGLGEGAVFNQGGQDFQIFYGADEATGNLTGGNDVAVYVVPEPTTGAALLLGSAVSLARRRRRR